MSGPPPLELRVTVAERATTVGAGASVSLRATSGDALALAILGPPRARVHLRVGRERHTVETDARGEARWRPIGLLDAAAGAVPIEVRLPDHDGARLDALLDVTPDKMTADRLTALLDRLESISPTLAGDLGGQSRRPVAPTAEAGDNPDARLATLEECATLLRRATPIVRARPLHRRIERRRAVASDASPTRPRDIAWLSRSVTAERIAGRGRRVGVHTRIDRDLDQPENRGLLGLFARLEAACADLDRRMMHERARLEAGRGERIQFQTATGNLYEERDRPRLEALDRRRRRLDRIADAVGEARAAIDLPRRLRPLDRLPLTPRVMGHPGYWQLACIDRMLADDAAHALPEGRVLAPVRNVDDLYEVFTTLELVSALTRALGRAPLDGLHLIDDGWFVRLARGLLWTDGAPDGWRIYREPPIRSRPREDDPLPLRRLDGGAWLQPDVVLVREISGWPVEVHVFDAKHTLLAEPRPGRPTAPWAKLEALWFKYGEGIVRADDGQPIVDSVWVMYPGRAAEVQWRTSAMHQPEWPVDRLRGGCVPILPGPDAPPALDRLVRWIVGDRR